MGFDSRLAREADHAALGSLCGSILEGRDALMLGAMGATKHHAAGRLQAMPDDPAAAMSASRRQGMDRALKAVKRVALAVHHDLEGLVILIAANFTCSHLDITPLICAGRR
jgi:hypothetical protein